MIERTGVDICPILKGWGWDSPDLGRLQWGLLAVESRVAFLSRMSPSNFEEEVSRLTIEFRQSRPAFPQFTYSCEVSHNPVLEEATRALLDLGRALHENKLFDSLQWGEELRQILIERTGELLLEVRLIQARGSSKVPLLSKERYSFGANELSVAYGVAQRWFEEGLKQQGLPSSESQVSLVSALRKLASSEKLNVRIVETTMSAVAAIGGETFYVRRGARVSRGEVLRIWNHEIYAHFLPRTLSKNAPIPLAIGTRSCSEDEEGRAILLEERGGWLATSRKMELSIRHQLAESVRESTASSLEKTLQLIQRGADLKLVVRTFARVSRGGGLAREIAYLPGYLRVDKALRFHPEWEDWMRCGRVSISAATTLSNLCKKA